MVRYWQLLGFVVRIDTPPPQLPIYVEYDRRLPELPEYTSSSQDDGKKKKKAAASGGLGSGRGLGEKKTTVPDVDLDHLFGVATNFKVVKGCLVSKS